MITSIITSFFISQSPVKVAVIDTGYSKNDIYNASLCDTGHKDFTEDQQYVDGVPVDLMGHGTHVAGLIHQYAENVYLEDSDSFQSQYKKINKLKQKDSSYCLIIVKAFSSKSDKIQSYMDAIRYVNGLKDVRIVNISAGGDSFLLEEKEIIKNMLDNNKVIIAAAGNSGHNIDIIQYYPASLDSRVIVVGNSNSENLKETENKNFTKKQFDTMFARNKTSNYGSQVDVFVKGENMLSISNIQNRLAYMTGTSQATAVFTGIILNHIKNRKGR